MSWGSIWSGIKTVAGAVNTVMNFGGGGTPGAGPAPSLVGQKPNLSFQRGRIGIGEGSGLMASKGDLWLDRPTGKPGNEWINLQSNYLAYLNMAEKFEDPGKVRRSIKLTV